MIEIAQKFYINICSASSTEEKQVLVANFRNYYHALPAEQKLVVQPFFTQLKVSIQADFQKVDTLTESLEKKYNMKFSEMNNFLETV